MLFLPEHFDFCLLYISVWEVMCVRTWCEKYVTWLHKTKAKLLENLLGGYMYVRTWCEKYVTRLLKSMTKIASTCLDCLVYYYTPGQKIPPCRNHTFFTLKLQPDHFQSWRVFSATTMCILILALLKSTMLTE